MSSFFWVKARYPNLKFSWRDDVRGEEKVSGMVLWKLSGIVFLDMNFNSERSEENQQGRKIQMLGKTLTDDSRAI